MTTGDFKKSPFIYLVVVILISSLVILASVGIFFYQFVGGPLSNDPAKWGVFGDYFGGTLNPAIALINLCVTIWIAVLLNRISDAQTEKQIQAQKQITLIQIRNEVFTDFRIQFNDAFNLLEDKPFYPPYTDNCIKVMRTFSEAYHQLFDLRNNEVWNKIGLELSLLKNAQTEEQPFLTEELRQTNVRIHVANCGLYKAALYGLILQKFFIA